jgi:hypothetical protein
VSGQLVIQEAYYVCNFAAGPLEARHPCLVTERARD